MKIEFLSIMLAGALASGCVTRNREAARNKALVGHYFEGWANRGDPLVAAQLIAANVVLRHPPSVVCSLAEYKEGMSAFHTAFPDLKFTSDEEISEGDKAAVRWTLHATHLGPYAGHPPSGKEFSVTGISIVRIARGRLEEIAVNMDRLGPPQQLGWLPPPE